MQCFATLSLSLGRSILLSPTKKPLFYRLFAVCCWGYVDVEFGLLAVPSVGCAIGGLGKMPGVYFRQQNADSPQMLLEAFYSAVDHALELPDSWRFGDLLGWDDLGICYDLGISMVLGWWWSLMKSPNLGDNRLIQLFNSTCFSDRQVAYLSLKRYGILFNG